MELKGIKKIKTYRLRAEMDVVPLVSVLLSLLCILMAQHPFQGGRGIYFRLPEVVNASDYPEAQNMVVVTQKWDGTVFVNDMAVEDISKCGQLILKELKRIKPRRERILLKIDRDTKYGQVVELMSQIKKVELYNIAFLAEKVGQ